MHNKLVLFLFAMLSGCSFFQQTNAVYYAADFSLKEPQVFSSAQGKIIWEPTTAQVIDIVSLLNNNNLVFHVYKPGELLFAMAGIPEVVNQSIFRIIFNSELTKFEIHNVLINGKKSDVIVNQL